ncbi:MAG: hypothetical protein KC561_12630 [Myxococcales bacterium]|nr:hypothetical protein [Myxococcales bacterium]
MNTVRDALMLAGLVLLLPGFHEEPVGDDDTPYDEHPSTWSLDLTVDKRPIPDGPIDLAELLATPQSVKLGWVGQQMTVNALYQSSSFTGQALRTLWLVSDPENPFDTNMGCRVAEGVTDPGLTEFTPMQIRGTLVMDTLCVTDVVFSLDDCVVLPTPVVSP